MGSLGSGPDVDSDTIIPKEYAKSLLKVERKPCRTCKKFVLAMNSPYANCRPCRRKKGDEKRRINVAMRLEAAEKTNADRDSDASEGDGTDVEARLGETVTHKDRRNSSHGKQDPIGIEYQNASELYSVLKSMTFSASTPGKRINFHGFHSIIAVDTISHVQRASLVAIDLHKISRVPFDRRNPSSRPLKTRVGIQVKYSCTCLGFIIDQEEPQQPSVPTKGVDIIKWARVQKRQRTASKTKTRVECHGTVKIVVEEDNSHPCGVAGQRISVTIEHSKS